MHYLALTLPGGQTIVAPNGVPTGGTDVLQKVLGNAMTIMVILAVLLSLIYLVWGGVQWTASGGDKNKIAGARAKLTFAIVGLLVALGAFLIVNIFGYFFNVKLFGF
jgi:hypothetical protein